MEKRLVTAILLTVAFLFIYSRLFPPPAVDPPAPPEEPAPAPPVSRPEEIPQLPVLPDIRAEESIIDTPLYRAVISGAGARITSFRLKEYQERWKPLEEIEREVSSMERRISKINSDILTIRNRMRGEAGEERLAGLRNREESLKEEQAALERAKEALFLLKRHTLERQQKIDELSRKIDAAAPGRETALLRARLDAEKGVELIPPRAVRDRDYPPSLILAKGIDSGGLLFRPDRASLEISGDEPGGEVVFTASAPGGLRLRKVYSFSGDDYSVNLRIEVENLSPEEISEEGPLVSYYPAVGLIESAPARGVVTGIVSFLDGRARTDQVGRGATLLPGREPVVRRGIEGWIGIKSKYFAAVILPQPGRCVLMAEALDEDGKKISVLLPGFTLEPGGVHSESLTLYLGPKRPEELGKVHGSLTEIIDFGFWSPVARVIDFLLKVFFEFFNNYGLAIIALSLTVKAVFYPLTRKSFKAMAKMQEDMKKIQPKLNELKKKYGNNQPKLNKATMELYKKEGVNPMSGCKGGCFPMLLQMPVFFALYAVLNTSIDMRGAHFIGWITDLSLPDPLRILPILMGISMFWQQKLTGTGAGGPQQEQAKMMQWMMPVMLTFIFFSLPAGIVLYWFSFNIFTSIQQVLIKKHGA